MATIAETTLNSIKTVIDLTFSMNLIPLKRISHNRIRIEPALQSFTVKYVNWSLLTAMLVHKLFYFIYRVFKTALSLLLVFHFVILWNYTMAFLCAYFMASKCEELKDFFNCIDLLAENILGKCGPEIYSSLS